MNGESVDTAIDFKINDTADLHYLYSVDKVLPRPDMYVLDERSLPCLATIEGLMLTVPQKGVVS